MPNFPCTKLPFWYFPDYTQYLINCVIKREYYLSLLVMRNSATLVQGCCWSFLKGKSTIWLPYMVPWIIHSQYYHIYIYHYSYNDISSIISNHWTSNDWTLDKYPQNYPINHWTTNLWYFPNIISIIDWMITPIINR